MKKKNHNILAFVIMLAIASAAPSLCAETIDKTKEYQLKAVFLFNFIKFTSWPGQKDIKKKTNNPAPIIIGIIGDAPFKNAFDAIVKQKINNTPIKIERIPGLKKGQTEFKDLVRLRKCHVLFISESQMAHTAKIVKIVKSHKVLTVGECGHCLENGGMINLFVEKNKISFDVNLVAVKKEKLQIRSKLLRLAKRVIKE